MKTAKPWLSLFLCLALLLAGCGAAGTEPPEEERVSSRRVARSAEDSAPTEAPAPVETPSPAETPAPCSEPPLGEVVRVRMTRLDSGEGEAVRFEGQDAEGSTVWERSASTGYRTELTALEEIGTWKDRYYFNNAGTLTCLSLADGSTLWENEGFGGASISSLIDQKTGAVYLCGWYGPDFFAADADGHTLADYRSASDDFFWPADMAYCGPDELVIYYHGSYSGEDCSLPYYVDLTDFSISWYFALEELDGSTQYWANIFVSDFIEQYMTDFDLETAGDMDLADFAYMFCKINRRGAISCDGDYETLSAETVSELCARFFGRTPDPQEGVLRTDEWGTQWRFANGKYYYPAADGEAFNRFAVVNGLLRLPDGSVQMSFDVYELNIEEYFDKGMDSALYCLSAAEAAALAAAGRIARLGSGTAAALPVEQSGRDGYWLLRLETSLG